jgi:hypothetical protein
MHGQIFTQYSGISSHSMGARISSLFKNTDEDSDDDDDKVFAVNDDGEDDENEGDGDAKED